MRAARWMAFAALSVGLMSASGGRTVGARGGVSTRMARLPRLTVWAWERREDLSGVDPRMTAVAYLARTVEVDGRGVRVVPRRQEMLLPAADGLVRIAVVRIEVANGTVLDADSARRVAEAIVGVVGASSIPPLRDETAQRWGTRGFVTKDVRSQVTEATPESPQDVRSQVSEARPGAPRDEDLSECSQKHDKRHAGLLTYLTASGRGADPYLVL